MCPSLSSANSSNSCYLRSFDSSDQHYRPSFPYSKCEEQQKVIRFRSLDRHKEDVFSLKLSIIALYSLNCGDIMKRVTNHLGVDDPYKIRLTSHNSYAEQPKPQSRHPHEAVSDMLYHLHQVSDILYYEVLTNPVSPLLYSKTLNVPFHHATKDEFSIDNGPRTVADLLDQLKSKVQLSHPNVGLRLLGIVLNRISKIPEEEKNLGPHDRIIKVCHFTREAFPGKTAKGVQNFGEPFFLTIHEGDTLADIKLRIQKKLNVPHDELSKWKFAYGCQDAYFQDSDIVYHHFQGMGNTYGRMSPSCSEYLGLEHPYGASERTCVTSQIPMTSTPLSNLNKPGSRYMVNGTCISEAEVSATRPLKRQKILAPYMENSRYDFKRSKELSAFDVIQMAEQVQHPTTGDQVISLAVKESGKITMPKYPDAGQLYDEGKHRHEVHDQKFEDIGGFGVLNTQATFYKKIWLKYGHIASSHVLTSSLYSIQVMLVTDIMTFIMDMQHCRLSEVSSATIDAWESKIKMAEKLEFNVKWLRDCFEDVKRYFVEE